jgi:glycosyltransferase involved in cell wall biosynthesis
LNAAMQLSEKHVTDTHRAKAIALVCRERDGEIDGIRDYTVQLADALRRFEGISAEILAPEALNGALVDYDAVVLQYNPFMYGRWGFAPWLPAALLRTRRRHPRLEVALMVHEPYVPMTNWRWTLMGIWQRSQLLIVHGLADVVFASIEAWAAMLSRLPPRRPTYHLPVGSNLPDMRPRREDARRRLGATEETVVLSAFGTAHSARRLDYVVAAANAVAESGVPTLVQNLGADASGLREISPSLRVSEPGRQSARELAEDLAATDVFLAPFVDGVSTRRTTVIAALQHALPIVGTDGHLTDGLLQGRRGMTLVPADDEHLFVAEVKRLASQPAERDAQRADARGLYEANFDWSVIAASLLRDLDSDGELGLGLRT